MRLSRIFILFPVSFLIYCTNTNEIEEREIIIQYARTYSGTLSTRIWDDRYWDDIGNWNSVEEYNSNIVPIPGSDTLRIYTSDEDKWYWIDDSSRIRYQRRRSDLK